MIGIICFWDRYATPYLQKYEKALTDTNISYEVIFWNRLDEGKSSIQFNDGEIVISSACHRKPLLKICDFLLWRRLVMKVLHRRKYERLIVLTTVPAFLLSGILIRKYKEKYIFDIRDYTFERIIILRRIVMRLIRTSELTAISSKGYMRWLENDPKIKVNHNITVESFVDKASELKGKRPIRFAFVGNVRLDTQTESLMLALGHHVEFEQHFYGRVLTGCNIEQIAKQHNLTNIHMHGPFAVEDKQQFFTEIDLLNAVYANCERDEDIPLGDSTPLPNRLYDALVFRKPLVASRGTYLAELIQQFNLGCVVNGFDKEAVDTIVNYVDSFDAAVFDKGAEKLLDIVRSEEETYMTALLTILSGWNNTAALGCR